MAPPAWNAGLQTGTRGARHRARRDATQSHDAYGLERRLKPARGREARIPPCAVRHDGAKTRDADNHSGRWLAPTAPMSAGGISLFS